MIKSELVTRLAANNPHLYQKEVERAVNTIFNEITNAMKDHNRVELRGFGAFSVRVREARVGRNPRTGELVNVAEKAAPFFRAGKEMRDRINAARPVDSPSAEPDEQPVAEESAAPAPPEKSRAKSAPRSARRRRGAIKDAAE